ncbi:hypothetical protein ACJMK2_020738 [Sinanodonta woodiana]|uniref:Sushi domain-containing protein n=1 Tax=Sinanodonta woodiana TaxID=1069815 RepID=A0ABD3U2X9_SINWO
MFATNLYCTLTEGVKIEYGTYFDGEELVTIHKISLHRCICECQAKTNRCESLIYKRRFTSYRLNVQKAAKHQEFSDQAGSIYVAMDNDVPGCEKYQMDATTDNSAVPFNQPACGKPQAKANATFKGNVYSNGSRIKYVCNKGFKQLDHTESVTMCLYNESWSEINFTCKPDTIAKSCRYNSECIEQSSECRENRCICISNYAYSLTSMHVYPVFSGNNDPNTAVTNQLPCPVEAQYIRINPQTYHKHMSLQFDLLGCTLNSADCDFQNDACGWQHVNTSLKRWEHGRSDITQGTPPNDHTCSSGNDSTDAMNCNYMYATSEHQEHGNAQVTQTIRRSNTSRCLSFWHTASNDFKGSLNIITVKCEQAIEKLRNKTIINFIQQWSMSTVPVESGVYQIVIEGVCTGENRGVLMIDDIKLNENDCT